MAALNRLYSQEIVVGEEFTARQERILFEQRTNENQAPMVLDAGLAVLIA